ncbi:MAG: carboxypeptidase-like regulatory domain-containing protein [Allomuricauda sp.]
MKKLFSPLLCLCALWTSAQDGNRKILRGTVTSTTEDVVGVVVQNISSEDAVITDIDGNFTIRVQVNDTLVFSAVHFQRKLLPVTDALYNSNFVTVPMEEFVNQLREVVVSPYNLSGILDKDLEKLPEQRIVDAEALGLPNANAKDFTQSERLLKEASSMSIMGGGGLGGEGGAVSLNPIINAITGRTKMLKNRLKVDNTYARTQRVQDFYVDSLFVTTLKIPMEKIEDFMYFCEVDETFQATVDSQDKLKIWDFMVEKSRVYRENNNLD